MPYYKIRNKPSGAKATAWSWFAKYVKLRDALSTTGTPERAKCVTCERIFPIAEMDAGHAIPGRTGGILFDESIVYAQCRECNRTGNGERQAFKRFLVELHGVEWYELKEQARKANTKLGEMECRLIADLYREKYNDLKKSI